MSTDQKIDYSYQEARYALQPSQEAEEAREAARAALHYTGQTEATSGFQLSNEYLLLLASLGPAVAATYIFLR